MAHSADALTVALPRPAAAPPAPARVPDPLVTARVPVAVPPTVEPVTARVPVAVSPAAPVEPVTARVPVAVSPAAPVEPVTARVPVAVSPAAPVEPVTARVPVAVSPAAPVEPVTARVPVPVPPAAPSTPVPAAVPGPDPVAAALAEVLAGVLGVEQVSVDAHFFDDLGADSMVMARFCARARKRDDLPSVSIKDVYRHPTITGLALARRARSGRHLRADRRTPHGLARPGRRGVRRGAGGRAGCGAGVGRRALLRRPGCGLDGDGAVLRPGPQAGRPAVGVDQGRLPAPDGRRVWLPRSRPPHRPHRPATAHGSAVRHRRAGPVSRSGGAAPDRPAPVAVAVPAPEAEAPVGTPLYVLCGVLQFLIFLAYSSVTSLVVVRGFEWVSEGVTVVGRLPAVGGVRLRDLRRAVCAADRGEVGAGRPVAAAADPGLEPGLRPVLGGQDPHPVEPAGPVRRVAALRVLPAGAGREGRARRRDLLPERARLHGPAHDRCRHGRSARTRSSAATGPTTA